MDLRGGILCMRGDSTMVTPAELFRSTTVDLMAVTSSSAVAKSTMDEQRSTLYWPSLFYYLVPRLLGASIHFLDAL